jgi:hypothetical protein
LSRIQSSNTQKPLMASNSTLLLPSSSSSHPQPWKPSDASQITRPTPSPAAAHPEKKTHPAQNAKNQQALFDEAMAKYLNGPVILEVANLANGTSDEDVKVNCCFTLPLYIYICIYHHFLPSVPRDQLTRFFGKIYWPSSCLLALAQKKNSRWCLLTSARYKNAPPRKVSGKPTNRR